jgi:chorismate mutase/prephenate dehydrogenase
LDLVAERMELAREIGEEKTRLGLPLRDYAVERVVLRRAEELALEHGLEPKLAERLFLALIEEACSVQERFSRHGATSLGRRVLIVGGWGRMGRWLAAFLRNQGHSVWILDPVAPANAMGRVATLAEGLNGAEFVLLAVPIDAVAEQMRGVAASGFSGVVADLASVKSPFLDAIREARSAGCRVTSFHPMFGPDAQTLAGKVVLFCDCGDSEATAALEAFLWIRLRGGSVCRSKSTTSLPPTYWGFPISST